VIKIYIRLSSYYHILIAKAESEKPVLNRVRKYKINIMALTDNENLLSESTEKKAVTEAIHSTDKNELFDLFKSIGMSRQLWRDLCLDAAINSGSSASTFRNRLKEDLSAIGVNWTGIFCHKQSTNCGYSNAWGGRNNNYQEVTVKVNGSYFTAFLTYIM